MKIFLLLLIIFLLVNKKNLIEPTVVSNSLCCGGMRQSRGDFKETDTSPPKRWKRCFKTGEWDSFPCTQKGSQKCCGGEGLCRPTRYGGKCEKNSTEINSSGSRFFIYVDDEKIDYTPDIEKADRLNYKDDEEDEESDIRRHDESVNMIYILCVFLLLILLLLFLYYLFRNNSKGSKQVIQMQKLESKPYSKYI